MEKGQLCSVMQWGSNSVTAEQTEAMMILNGVGEIVYATAAVRTVLGYDRRELIGRSAFDLLLFYRKSKARLQYESIVQQPNLTIRCNLRIKNPCCLPVRVELTLRNLLHQPGVGGVLVTIRKISRRSNPL